MDYIISFDELRSEIGSPTADPREASAVKDEELKAIIDRVRKNVDRIAKQRLEKRVLQSTPPSSSHIFSTEKIDLTEKNTVAEGEVPSGYYPLSFSAARDSNGEWYTHDSSLEFQSQGYFTRRRYKFEGDKVLVIPKTTSELRLPLPDKIQTRQTLAAEAIQKANDKIIQQAWQMVQRKTKVGKDLERSDLNQ